MNLNQVVSDFVYSKVSSKIYYMPAEDIDRIDSKSDEPIGDPSALCVILPRAMYQEWVKNYPIENKTDLLAILKSEASIDCFNFYRIAEPTNRARTVTCWQIPKFLRQLFPKALLFIPESVILADSLPVGGGVEFKIHDARLFVLNGHNGIRSGVSSGFINSLELFCCSVGVQLEAYDAREISAVDIKMILRRARLNLLARFLLPINYVFDKIPIKQFSLYCFSMFLFFQIFEVGYFKMIESSSFAAVEGNSEQVDHLLAITQKNNSIEENLTVQKQILTNKKYMSEVWRLLHKLKSTGVALTNIEIDSGSIVVRGSAKSATQTLETIKEFDGVLAATFDNAVRRQGEQEQFSIRLSYGEVSHARD